MEEIESVIESLQERRKLYREEHEKEEKKQIEDYDVLMEELKALQKEFIHYQESINNNLNNLITQKLSVQKLTRNSEQTPGLPISYDYHQQTVQFFSDAINFINAFQTSDGPLDILQNNDIDEKLTNDIVKCSHHIQSEFNKTTSALLYIEKARENIEILRKLNFKSDDEDAELNSSDS